MGVRGQDLARDPRGWTTGRPPGGRRDGRWTQGHGSPDPVRARPPVRGCRAAGAGGSRRRRAGEPTLRGDVVRPRRAGGCAARHARGRISAGPIGRWRGDGPRGRPGGGAGAVAPTHLGGPGPARSGGSGVAAGGRAVAAPRGGRGRPGRPRSHPRPARRRARRRPRGPRSGQPPGRRRAAGGDRGPGATPTGARALRRRLVPAPGPPPPPGTLAGRRSPVARRPRPPRRRGHGRHP